MSFAEDFLKDEQFLRLVRREPDVDLVTVALELARDGQPDLDFAPPREVLHRAISRLTHPVTQAGSDLEELKLVVRYMTEELCLHGEDSGLPDPDAHYLPSVLRTGRGIPISLSLIYLHVANELGIPLEPVGAPARFLTRLATDGGNLYVDAFDHGRILDEQECIELIRGLSGLPAAEVRRSLRRVDERAIVIRMLQNLKAVFGRHEQWIPAWRVQCRLRLLSPGSWRERRDHAVLTFRAGRYGEAISLLEQELAVCPGEDRNFLQNHLRQARKLLPDCN
jgi:regulator of sirC expression with transglutaminase-like and TPR domain